MTALPSGRLVPGVRWEPAGVRHRRCLLRMTGNPPCRRFVGRIGLAEDLGPFYICITHDASVQCAVQLFHETIGGRMVGARPAEVDPAVSPGYGRVVTRTGVLGRL